MPSFQKWKMLYFNQIDYKQTKEHFFIKKDKNTYPACKIYHGLYYCKENYIGESKLVMATRWGEHNTTPMIRSLKNIRRKISSIATAG